jgi:hypothetical protein
MLTWVGMGMRRLGSVDVCMWWRPALAYVSRTGLVL